MEDIVSEEPTTNGENDFEETVDDDEYDAWNDETFGDTNLNTDWEESHEILSGLEEQSKNNFDEENGELSKRMASFILDDENDDIQLVSISTPAKQPLGNTEGESSNSKQIEDSTNWWNAMKNKKLSWPEVKPSIVGPNIKTLLSVQDLERSILMQSCTTPPVNQRQQGKLVLQHVEDVERELKNNVLASNVPVQKLSNQVPPPPGGFNISLPPPLPSIRPPLQPPVTLQLQMWMNQGGHHRHGLYTTYRPQGVAAMTDYRHYNNMSCMLQPMMGGPVDPYAGLMTPQEKQWLASIQVMQLSTASQAYQDDYYYLMYQSRQQGSCGRKLGNQVFKTNREITSTKNTYIPLQFENSLGKLQVGSVTAPRKIIDVDYNVLESSDSAPLRAPCRTRRILLEIEWMYDVLLKIEELNYFNCGSGKTDEPVDIASDCINKILNDNKFLHIMEIRKGRNVVLRLIAHLGNAGPLIRQLISHMIPVTQKDNDQTLLRFLPAIRTWLSSVSLSTLIELCTTFEESYEFILSNKFTVSVLTNMIERAEKIISSPSLNNVSSSSSSPSSSSSSSTSSSVTDVNVEKWLSIIEKVAKTATLVKHIERPVVGINATLFTNHLARIQTTNREQFTKLQVAISTTRTPDISSV